jgi:hypothetical protein
VKVPRSVVGADANKVSVVHQQINGKKSVSGFQLQFLSSGFFF